MTQFTNKEITEAATALMEWFESQDIGPGNAALVMVRINAISIAAVATDVEDAERGIRAHDDVLRVEVAHYIRQITEK